jgi:hypothetical protein
VDAARRKDVLAEAQAAGVLVRAIGRTGGDEFAIAGDGEVPLATLRALYEGWFPAYMDGTS